MIQGNRTTTLNLILNNIILGILAFLCLAPMLNILALSLSASYEASAGNVTFWPRGFHLEAYKYVLSKPEMLMSFSVSVKRVLLGALINMTLTVLMAYPLSKDKKQFAFRDVYVWYLFITILFSGGLIPTYFVVKYTGLIDSIWALVLPSAVPVFNIILLLNFFRQLPKELEESAFIDGAGYIRTLVQIILPVSKPVLATLMLFVMVYHGNAWFDGIIYMNDNRKYPLQTFMQTIITRHIANITTTDQAKTLALLSDRNVKSAQIFIAMAPILCVYPFLQKYFAKGIVLGSVKG